MVTAILMSVRAELSPHVWHLPLNETLQKWKHLVKLFVPHVVVPALDVDPIVRLSHEILLNVIYNDGFR